MKRWGLGSQSNVRTAHVKRKIRYTVSNVLQRMQSQNGTKLLRMEATKTHPQLRHDLIAGLKQWHDAKPPQSTPFEGSLAGIPQEAIGWGMALEGSLSYRWQEEQDIYWKAFKLRKSSKRWTVALIKWLVTTAWDMWKH